jgi:hypothetical protein
VNISDRGDATGIEGRRPHSSFEPRIDPHATAEHRPAIQLDRRAGHDASTATDGSP